MKGRPEQPTAALVLGGLVASAVAVASCTGGEPGPASFEAPRWELSDPDLRIEADAAGAPLRYVEALTEGSDGAIHSLHAREPFVRSWTTDGRPAGTPASGGGGAEPLPDPEALGVFGDTLWVMDGQTHRVHLFGPGGGRVGLLEPSVASAGGGHPWDLPPSPRRPLRDGGFLAVAPEVSEAVARGDQRGTVHARLDADGTVRDTVWIREWRPRDVLVIGWDAGAAYGIQPFADSPLAAAATGGALVVVDRRVLDGREPPGFHVTWIGMAGDTLARTAVAYDPGSRDALPVEEAVAALVERWGAFLREGGDSTGTADLEDRIRDALYVPAHAPPVTELVVGADGSAWLRRPGPRGEGVEWWVLGPDGGFRARVAAPADLRILWAGPGHVLGTVVDSTGTTAIVRHPVRR